VNKALKVGTVLQVTRDTRLRVVGHVMR